MHFTYILTERMQELLYKNSFVDFVLKNCIIQRPREKQRESFYCIPCCQQHLLEREKEYVLLLH